MFEAYSTNISVTAGDGTAASPAIPLNNLILKKGCTAELSAPATIQFNKCGVYMLTCDASAEATTAGEISIQLIKDGVLQPQAQSIETGAVESPVAIGFTTLVQVPVNNSCCACSSPTVCQILNTGVDADYNIINVCVTKVC